MVDRIINNYLSRPHEELSASKERDVAQARSLREGLLTLGYTDQSGRWAMAYLLKRGNLGEKKVSATASP
jgi:hypothetical protein